MQKTISTSRKRIGQTPIMGIRCRMKMVVETLPDGKKRNGKQKLRSVTRHVPAD